jgi:tRNA/tmRNA/rRNA uracil-C5-methylase (TrmA/RlmC/RlmD family)
LVPTAVFLREEGTEMIHVPISDKCKRSICFFLLAIIIVTGSTFHRVNGFVEVVVHPLRNHRPCCRKDGATTAAAAATNYKNSPNPDRYINKKKHPNLHKKANTLAKPRSKEKSTRNPFAQSKVPPPLLVDYVTNGPDNTEMQRHRSMDDDSILQTCIHYDTCAGCTLGSNVTDTNIIRAAQRYFAPERYDAKIATATMTRQQQQQQQQWGSHRTGKRRKHSYPVIVPTPTTQWRTQAKLVAANRSAKNAWKKEGCVFGLYEKGTHQVRPIPNCVVHHPSINQAVQILEMATRRAGISAYQEDDREGDLRYVQLQVERATGRVSLTLVWNASTLKQCQPALSRLIKELNHQLEVPTSSSLWHSVWLHCNDSTGNNIFSRSPGRWHHLSGPEFLREPMPVATLESNNHAVGWLYFTPLTFRQGNLDGFDILALDVAAAIPGGSKVCELYGGVGVLGLTALAYHHNQQNPLIWLRCSDENPSNSRCFQRAVDSLPNDMTGNDSSKRRPDLDGITLGEIGKRIDSKKTALFQYKKERAVAPSRKTSYTVSSAANALQMGQALGAQVLIVDPPRKGLEDEVLEELCKPFNADQPCVDDATFLSIPEEKIHWTNDVQTLVYVSCGFDALARDCDQLLSSNGGWSLRSSSGYLLFPGSDHIETLAIFDRK